MPQTLEEATVTLPGAVVIRRIRRLLVVSVAATIAYPIFMAGSAGYCPGGFDESGGFLDASGHPTEVAPQCIELTLKPSPVIFVAIISIVLWAVGRVIEKSTEAEALRVLDRSAAAVGIIVAVSIVVAHVWFQLIPITDWGSDHSYSFVYPFPFGSVEETVTPMQPDEIQ